MQINLYDLVSMGTLFAGLTLALLLAFAKKPGQAANLYLSMALGVITLKTGGVSSVFLPALGPLLYFYVRRVTFPDRGFRRKDLLHFCPVLAGYWIPAWPTLILVIVYLYWAHRLIQDFYRRIQPVLMDRPRFTFRQLDRALLLLGLLCLLGLLNAVFSFAIAFVLIAMAAEAILKTDSSAPLHLPMIDTSVEKEKGRRLKEAVGANRLYEDAELTLTTLAVKLRLQPHELSRIINLGLKKNFNDFINEFRVREVARKMQDPACDRLTLLGIAYESGFNSQRTFSRVFKDMTGKTPAEYKNSLKKDWPNDDLANPSRMRPLILRPESPPNSASQKSARHFMFRNYLKIAYRNLIRDKIQSLINIVGLTAGTLSCLYILLYVRDQYSYDRHHANVQDIYRITTAIRRTGDQQQMAVSSLPIAPALKQDFPEVAAYTRVYPSDQFGNTRNMVSYGDRAFDENSLAYVDSTFFDVLSYHFVHGGGKVLSEPYTAVLMSSTATKLFGNDNPIGKVITIDNNYGKNQFKITGVVDESLGKTNIHANILVTMRSGGFGRWLLTNADWAGNNMVYTYLKLRPGASHIALEGKLPAFLIKYASQQLKSRGMTKALHLQPVTAIHTTPGYETEMSPTISPALLYIFSGVAILIQLIACINFMNLSTARASRRAKEVGVRKIIGAERADLVKQFLGESFILTLIAVLLAVPLLYVALPYLNQLTNANIQLTFPGLGMMWLALLVIILVTGGLAGSYPAFYLSAFQAIRVIKGNFTNHISASGIRRSLVVFQFFLSIGLITSIIIIYSQLNYIKNKDLGFDKSQKLVFNFYTNDARTKMAALAGDLQQLSEVKYASVGDSYLNHYSGSNLTSFYLAGGDPSLPANTRNMAADEKFVRANGLRIVAGRDFEVNDTSKTLVNETLCRHLNLPVAKAPGARLYSKDPNGTQHFFEIVGVIKDFNYESLHGGIIPFMIFHSNNPGNYFSFMTVSVNSKHYGSLLNKIESVWKKDLPGIPFEYAFLDQEIQKQYEAEQSLSQIINSFTIMAILISCLGLFGLVAFSAEQRRKEIGIRKVLGASVASLFGLLSREFVVLVGLAFLLVTPLAWWVMHRWLQSFAYQVSVSWWMFAAAGGASLVIAVLTISFQAVKAAIANPVKSLRSE
jgi:putative ABC transport system permease protein